MSARVLPLSLIGVALLSASADAAAPHAPTTPRQAGVRLHWPTSKARVTLRPGATVFVRVRSLRRGSASLTVALTRTDGAKARVVKRRTLRRGLFAASLPQAAGARYVLSAAVGRRTLRRLTIVTPRRQAARPVTAPQPKPQWTPPLPKPSPLACPLIGPWEGRTTLTGDRTTVTAGEMLTVTVLNSGPTCLQGGYGYGVERQGASGWRSDGLSQAVPAVALMLRPGQTFAQGFIVPDATSVQPGHYRIVTSWSAPGEGRGVAVTSTWEFNVLPAGPLPSPDRCGEPDSAASVAVALDRTTITPADTLELTVTNDGPVCLTGDDARVNVYKLADGYIWRVDLTDPGTPYGTVRYAPGESRRFSFRGAEGASALAPGRYVVSYPIWVPPADAATMTGLTAEAEFEVVAAG